MEAVNSSTNASICPSNLPLHAFFFFAMSALPVLQHRPDLEPERVDLHEPFRVALVEHRFLLEGGEIGPVEGHGAYPARCATWRMVAPGVSYPPRDLIPTYRFSTRSTRPIP